MCVTISAYHCHIALFVLIHPFWSFSQPCCLSILLSAPPVPHYCCFTTVLMEHKLQLFNTRTVLWQKNILILICVHAPLWNPVPLPRYRIHAIKYFLLYSAFSSLWCQEKSYSSMEVVLTQKLIFLMCQCCVYMRYVYIYIYHLN